MKQDRPPKGPAEGTGRGRMRCTDPGRGSHLAAYEMGILPPAEQAAFEEHLRSCGACAEDLYANAPAAAVIHEMPASLAARLDWTLRERGAAPATRRGLARTGAKLRDWFVPHRWIDSWRPLVPVAAAAVLVLLIVLTPGGPTDLAGLARIEPLPYQRLETRAVGADAGRRLLEKGMDAYARAAYPEAAALLARAIPLLPSGSTREARDQAAIHAGVSYLLSGRADSAAVCLEIARSSPLAVLADRARWYLAQAALQRGEAKSALGLLDSLALGSPGYAERAAEQARVVRATTKRR